jgi:hypothetical protein
MSGWTIAWLLWGAMFVAIEAPAILNRAPGDTLSEHVREWFATRTKPKHWRIRRLVLACFLLWLAVHFFLGW